MENIGFLSDDGNQIFYCIHNPNGSTKKTIVFCHGFPDHSIAPRRIGVKLARYLSQNGFRIVRFDYRGCGNSSHSFEEIRLLDHFSDLRSIVQFISKKYRLRSKSDLYLLGLSIGGIVVGQYISENNINNVCLINCPIDVKEVFIKKSELIRRLIIKIQSNVGPINVLKNRVFDYEGNEISYQFF